MKRHLLFKSLLLLCALIVGSTSVWAADQTLFDVTTASNWGTSNSTYSSTVWSSNDCIFAYAANNNKGFAHVRLGGKNISGVDAYIATTTATTIQTKQLDVTVAQAYSNGGLTINSITLYVYGTYNSSTKAYSNEVEHISYDVSKYAAGTMTFKPSSGDYWNSGVYFKLVYNVSNSSTSKNYGTDVSKLVAKEYTSGGTPTVEEPTFSPGTETYTTAQNVTLGCTTDGATIHYTMTTDGSTPNDPTESDPTYTTAPISVTLSGTKIKAKAFKDGYNASSVASATYTIQPTKPTFEVTTVVSGKVNRGAQLTMSAAAGNTIIYTTNGTAASYSEPNGDIYDTPITINNPMTIKAIAVDGYGNESQQAIETYAIYYAGGVDITPNFTFFGKNAAFSNTDFDEVTGTTAEGIVVTYTRNGASLYANTTSMRFYKKNTLKIDAPAGKTITNVIFTQGNAQTDDMTSTPDGYSSTTKTWSGDASSVTFTRPSTADSYLQFTKIEVVLANKATIAAACTDGEGMYYGTYSSGKAFIVPADLVVSEIKVDNGKLQLSDYTTGDVVPANTGVLIASDAAGSFTMEIATGGTSKLGANNMLKPSGDAGITAANMNEDNTKFYRLTMHDGQYLGFWWGAENGAAFALAANKAYLAVPTTNSVREGLWIDDDATGVRQIENGELTNENSFFNLAGQRVAQPTKGLYIVNGKKVVIK